MQIFVKIHWSIWFLSRSHTHSNEHLFLLSLSETNKKSWESTFSSAVGDEEVGHGGNLVRLSGIAVHLSPLHQMYSSIQLVSPAGLPPQQQHIEKHQWNHIQTQKYLSTHKLNGIFYNELPLFNNFFRDHKNTIISGRSVFARGVFEALFNVFVFYKQYSSSFFPSDLM